jgi:hypothetical protein
MKDLNPYVRVGDLVKIYEGNKLQGNYIVSLIPQIRAYDKVTKNDKTRIIETEIHVICLINTDHGTTWHTPRLIGREWNEVSSFRVPLSLLLGSDLVIESIEHSVIYGAISATKFEVTFQTASESTGITRVIVKHADRQIID